MLGGQLCPDGVAGHIKMKSRGEAFKTTPTIASRPSIGGCESTTPATTYSRANPATASEPQLRGWAFTGALRTDRVVGQAFAAVSSLKGAIPQGAGQSLPDKRVADSGRRLFVMQLL
jgi:hypothetical protein